MCLKDLDALYILPYMLYEYHKGMQTFPVVRFLLLLGNCQETVCPLVVRWTHVASSRLLFVYRSQVISDQHALEPQ